MNVYFVLGWYLRFLDIVLKEQQHYLTIFF